MEGNLYSPLSEPCARLLADKLHDKRKLASQEVEKMVIEFNISKNTKQIQRMLNVLERQFIVSSDPNKKRGGLLGIAAVSIGLGKDTELYIKELVNPILNCLKDVDSRVRYSAIEALYNVVKVCRGTIVPIFPDIFKSLSTLVTDPDSSVRNGSELLDRLLKDILSESTQFFDLAAFVPLLRERIYAKDSSARQFIISWISILNVIPDINLVVHLPELLDGLFQMLDDSTTEIQRLCESLLNQFLKGIRNDPKAVDLPAMTNILIGHAQSSNELIQATAIRWISEFVQWSGPQMLQYTHGILTAILPCLAYDESKKQIRDAQAVNQRLFEMVSASNANRANSLLDLDPVMEVLRQYMTHSSMKTKVAVLKWIHHLFTEIHDEMNHHAVALFPVLLGVLSDSSDEVVLQGLEVLAEIVKSSDAESKNVQYRKFLLSLLNLFSEEKSFLENKGSLIIRQLCVLLNAELIFRTFAEIIMEETSNVRFASTMVRTLNLILLTSSELFELRSTLRNIIDPKSASLFECLYKCWSHCPISTLSLCLLSQCYQHVYQLVILFGDLEITMEFLLEIDKLVQLIESPIFAALRLTLIEHDNADAYNLTQALYGILMLLPQTEAFGLLKHRLQCIPRDVKRPESLESSVQVRSQVDFNALMVHFKDVQRSHQQQQKAQRVRQLSNTFSDTK